MSLQIYSIDPTNDGALSGWYDAYLAADTHGRDHAIPWQYAEFAAALRLPPTTDWRQAWVAVAPHTAGSDGADGQAVGAGLVEFPLTDNLDLAWIQTFVPPTERGAGVGSALLAAMEQVAIEGNRHILASEASYRFGGEPEEGPDVAWAVARGYRVGQVSVQRRLRLAEGYADRLAELGAQAAAYHGDYTLVGWSGTAPEELLPGLAALSATLTVEAPAGELLIEAGSSDPAAFRHHEQTLAAQGRTRHTTVALDTAGEVVAYSDLISSLHTPELAYQWGTLVRPADRGHRLGLAVKAANLQRLLAQVPSVREVTTHNAGENAAMVAVNDALGFVPVEGLAELQKLVPGAADPR